MALLKKKRKPLSVNPGILLIYGPPKIGKTTMLSKLKECLIVDTESGSNMIEGYIENVNTREELLDFYTQATEGHDYKYFLELMQL